MTKTLCVADVEAANEKIAADFQGLPAEIEPWQLRKLARSFAPALKLSKGAEIHLLEMLEAIGEPQWRSSSPLAFRSIISCAVKRRASERQISRYEREIILAGLAYRPVKHGRRHNGHGGNGLNFAPLVVRLDYFRNLAADAEQLEKDHSRARSAYRSCIRKIYQAIARARMFACLDEIREIAESLEATKIARISARMSLAVIDRAHASAKTILQRLEALLTTVDNRDELLKMADQSDILDAHTETTDNSFPSESCNDSVDKRSRPNGRVSQTKMRANARYCLEKDGRKDRAERQPIFSQSNLSENIIHTALMIAGSQFIEAYTKAPCDGWVGMRYAAESRISHLRISSQLWRESCERMGEDQAALALIVVEAKFSRDEIRNPGGYMRGLGQRAVTGSLNITKSIFGIAKARESVIA